jgi:hypothetical protein
MQENRSLQLADNFGLPNGDKLYVTTWKWRWFFDRCGASSAQHYDENGASSLCFVLASKLY